MNKTEFLGCIAAINALWQPPIQTKPELDIWNQMIGGMDYMQVEKAIMVLAQKSQYRPTVAQINEAIADLTGTKRISAAEAWIIARPLCSRYTTREQLEKLDPEIRAALNEAGHASYLGTLEEEQARRAFMGAWKAKGDTESREQVQRIGGKSELTRIGQL